MKLKKNGWLIILFIFFCFTTLYFIISISLLKSIANSFNEFYNIAYIAFNAVLVLTLFFGNFFINRFNKFHFIYVCLIILTVITPILFIPNIALRMVIIFIQGIFIGLGQLSSLKYFWNLTVLEERGRVAGVVGFFILPMFQIASLVTYTVSYNEIVIITILICAMTLAVKLFEPDNKFSLTKKMDQEGHNHEKKTVIFYTIPWILFSLVNVTLARNVSNHIFEIIPSGLQLNLSFLQIATSGFGALIGGLISDFIGRRSALSTSLTLYGISIILSGFAQYFEVLYFAYILNGITWGILWALYGFVIWGDLGAKENVVKMYSMGLMIFYLITAIGVLFKSQFSQFSLIYSSFLGCFFVLLSNIPVILAQELLSKDFRDKMKLKLFINSLRKIRA
jgi:MFS family permease